MTRDSREALSALVALLVFFLIGYALYFFEGKPGTDFRACVAATHDKAACERLVYPDKEPERKAWRERAQGAPMNEATHGNQ